MQYMRKWTTEEEKPTHIQQNVKLERWDLGGPINTGYPAHCSHFFTSVLIVFLSFYTHAISEFYDTDFASQVVYKP